MKISTRLIFIQSAVFVAASLVLVFLVNHFMREQALEEARAKARVLLDRNLATHTYFTHQLRPRIFELTDAFRPEGYFDPTWMSSTFAVRQVDQYFRQLSPGDYYYKECAINARSPENEADEWERAFIQELNREKTLEERSLVRSFDGVPFFQTLRRGEVMEASCLRCHSQPENAPSVLVSLYGSERSFGRSVGEVVSAVSIRVPLAAAYGAADRFSLRLSAMLLALFVLQVGVQALVRKRLLLRPLHMIREKAVQISAGEHHLGEEIPLPVGRELRELATAFNAMSVSLRQGRDQLEQRVADRTAQLTESNRALRAEIEERQRLERERERVIADLQEAVEKVKTLRGLLPICASCKKIRDDRGYWNQIESYIREHSEAEFSHGICPDCFRKLYPDWLGKDPSAATP